MVDTEHVTELLPAYALGALDDVEVKEVEEHLKGCAACRRELARYEDVARDLAYAVPRSEPPAELKQRILGEISGTATALAAPDEVASTWWERRLLAVQQFFTGPVWRPVLLLLLVVLGIGNLALWRRLQQAQDAAPFRAVRLAGTENADEATGVIIISEDGAHGALIVQQLPMLGEEHEYQLWLIDNGERTDGGTFSVDEDGYRSHYVSAPRPLGDYEAFGVTIEPAGGSPGPTGPQVLGSTQ